MICLRANVRARARASSRSASAGESRSNSGHRFRNQIVSLMRVPGRRRSAGARPAARAPVPAYPTAGRLTTPGPANPSPVNTALAPFRATGRFGRPGPDHPLRPAEHGSLPADDMHPRPTATPGGASGGGASTTHTPRGPDAGLFNPADRAVAVHALPRQQRAHPHAPVPGRTGTEQLGRHRVPRRFRPELVVVGTSLRSLSRVGPGLAPQGRDAPPGTGPDPRGGPRRPAAAIAAAGR